MNDYDFFEENNKRRIAACVPILVYLTEYEKNKLDTLIRDGLLSIDFIRDDYDGSMSDTFKWLFKC